MSVVLLQCVKEGAKLRVKILSSSPFIQGYNCQFPRNLREEGRYFVVKTTGVKLRGNFYTVKASEIVCQTFNRADIDVYLSDNQTQTKPSTIYGDETTTECIICMVADKDTVCAPCGHYMTCSACSNRCTMCPMCRTHIKSRIHISEMGSTG
jgi:hypothetical protein